MNIDMAALHAIEADKGISVDVVVETIKSALLTAYRHTEGHEPDAGFCKHCGTVLPAYQVEDRAGLDEPGGPGRAPPNRP